MDGGNKSLKSLAEQATILSVDNLLRKTMQSEHEATRMVRRTSEKHEN